MSAGRSTSRGVAGGRDGERRGGGYAPRRAAGEGPAGERRVGGGQRGERPGGRSYGDDSRRGGAWTRDERPARGVVAGSRRPGPAVEPPADIDPRELAHEVRSQLRTLSKVAADRVARHLVAAGRLVDEDPQAALEQARAARALGARVAVVREAVGETAYAAGEWAEAIAELRTARRMTGDDSSLPMIADAERALGRPERALRIAQSPEVQGLAPAERAEMRIVEAGARRDLGQLDAALVTLQDFGLDQRAVQPWSARVWYAYADLLLAAGREDEARDWFLAAAGADPDGTTDADERLLELDGIEILTDDDDEDDDIPEATPLVTPSEPAIDETARRLRRRGSATPRGRQADGRGARDGRGDARRCDGGARGRRCRRRGGRGAAWPTGRRSAVDEDVAVDGARRRWTRPADGGRGAAVDEVCVDEVPAMDGACDGRGGDGRGRD